jgi:hypothetical protein
VTDCPPWAYAGDDDPQSSPLENAMTETFTPQTLLNTAAAAERLGVSPSFLAKARMHGLGPRYRKLGRAVRYAHGDLEHWLLSCGRTSTAEQSAVTGFTQKASSRA